MSGEFEKSVRTGISLSRWLLAPMYLGLGLMLIVLLIQFVRDFFSTLPQVFQLTALEALSPILSLAIVLLTAHALLAVLQTGYQLFVPGLRPETQPAPGLGAVDATKLRNTLLGVTLALAVLAALRAVLTLPAEPVEGQTDPLWRLAALLGLLVATALVLAIADWFTALARARTSGDQPGSHGA